MNELRPAPAGRRPALRFAWALSVVAFCVLFVVASVPPARAESALEENRRLTQNIVNVFEFIQRHYVDEVEARKLYEGAMRGMLESLDDPYSMFLPASDMLDFTDITQGNFGGVGLYISKQVVPKDGTPSYVEVSSPIEDTPGWRAGIKAGDLILEIDGETTADLDMDEVLARLRGPAGSQVVVLVRRGENLTFPVTLVRAVIEVPVVKSAMIGDVGYVRVISFTPMTAERFADALASFQKAGYKSLVLDLRNNTGGLLQAGIAVADFFLDGGVVVSTKSRIPAENAVFTARSKTTVPKAMPVVVLVNRGSASASEIVAGALKDRGRAYLVGEKSYGKGSVQNIINLDAKTGFKITTSRYYTPSDVNIDKIGIPPDLEVKFPEIAEAEAEALGKLLGDKRIQDFAKANPAADPKAQASFAAALAREYGVGETLLRRLVRDEFNRTEAAPVYDLEYDIQLQAAIDVLRGGSYAELMKKAKTLKVLQEEASAAVAAADAAAPQAKN